MCPCDRAAVAVNVRRSIDDTGIVGLARVYVRLFRLIEVIDRRGADGIHRPACRIEDCGEECESVCRLRRRSVLGVAMARTYGVGMGMGDAINSLCELGVRRSASGGMVLRPKKKSIEGEGGRQPWGVVEGLELKVLIASLLCS